MRSLRGQLILGVALGTSVVLVASGVLLDALISRTLWAEFDDALAARARALSMLVEEDEEGLDFEAPDEAPLTGDGRGGDEYYQLWRSDGRVLARSGSLGEIDLLHGAAGGGDEAPGLRARAPQALTMTAGGGEAGLAFRGIELVGGRRGRVVVMTFEPRRESDGTSESPTVLTLAVARETTGLLATLARVRGILAGVCLAAVVLSCAVLAWLVRRGLKPVERLSGRIGELDESDLSVRLDAPEIPRELAPVVERLNRLLERLGAAFQRERRFTGDVAHELRTPLAGLRSKLEVALSRERAPDAYRQALGDCLGINLHMQRMVENLLHLARADAGQFDVLREPVDVAALIRSCWEPLSEKADARGLHVEWRLHAPGVVRTDREKLQVALQNVLENAVTYAERSGRVSIAAGGDNGAVRIAVENTGNTLPGEQMPHVFERFWRGAAAHTPAELHCGLGLSLSKAVIERLGGTIDAASPAVGVFLLTMRLPRDS